MSSNTIDYGIDLGTTNSTIAKLKGIEVQIFKNNEGFEFTPSAVYMDNKERIQVGRRAKEQLENDPENAYSEFKLQMGSSDVEFAFSRSKKTMTPIELSAEILKSLKADVKLQTGEDLTSAVITVPAGFELPQCKATQAAAEMAGFTTCPLLMEPIAAAMAYGYQSTSDRVFWLVYDFGGGTFDAAIIQVRDGIIEVINHGGDNHLGGKLIDWEIVNGIFVPALVKKYSLEKFYHGNVKWRVAFAKLKAAAENAKIRLSREEDVEVNVEFKDEKNAIYELSLELSKSDLERIAQPFVSRSINICKKVIADKRLKTGDIEKVLLVGGTTLIPVLRELLSDPERGLGIPLESSHYPLTVVAEGAAIFAGTQQIKPMTDDRNNLEANEYMLELDYNSVGTDMEPLLGGKVIGNKEASLKDYSIEFINTVSRPEWRSGKIRINSESGFVTTLWAEKGKTNVFKIELTDLKGTVQITKPDSVSYTIGMTIDAPPLIHSIGVAMANNETDLFFEKGISLPSRKKQIHKTIHDIRPNQESDSIRIPVVEGENLKRASRNRLIGYLEISASNIKRTVPAGSEIEIVIEIDSSRMIKTKAYIPIIDEEFEEVIELSKQKISIDELKQDVKAEFVRLNEIITKILETGDHQTELILAQIEGEQMEHEIENSLKSAEGDRDSADKCKNRLLDLQSALDNAEDALEWPTLLIKADESIEDVGTIVTKYGSNDEKSSFDDLSKELRSYIVNHEPDLLRRNIDMLESLRTKVLLQQPGYWVNLLDLLVDAKAQMNGTAEANLQISKGKEAIQNNDIDELKKAVNRLFDLLPSIEREKVKGFGGGTIK